MANPARPRCAIYTRKSTEDGLDQAFNSLDAQYEACAAYSLSQRHEGWTLVPDRYDDGGFSGGTMERPGLKQLLADVAAGKVDIILLYKIDRLTRSLTDFAKIVEVLDGAGASFVSITQSFNTTTSMGRLTLNMLLSFAQFEREVTGERIRDKIAASKRRGMWMGGPVPLGYDVKDRKLIIKAQEADLVRHIMQRYLALDSVVALAEELSQQGHRTKVQQRTSGPHRGGCIFRRGTLYHLLSNPIYRGKIVHKGEVFDGEHEPIIPEELWNDVQARLSANASGSSRRLRIRQPSLLIGKVRDGEGRAMTPSHATKSVLSKVEGPILSKIDGAAKRYRYYVTRPDQLDGAPSWRVSAHDLEKLVCERLATLLGDRQQLCDLIGSDLDDATALQRAMGKGDLAAATLRSGPAHDKAALLSALVDHVGLGDEAIEIGLVRAALLTTLQLPVPDAAEMEMLAIATPATRVRRGHQIRLVIPGVATAPVPPARRDERLVALVAEAYAARQLFMRYPDRSLASIATSLGRCRTRLTKLVALSCLAPDIVTAIVEGRQPSTLTRRDLLEMALPFSWREQRKILGFA
jgi:site-specific DNA recombinase